VQESEPPAEVTAAPPPADGGLPAS
jgi:hypothetical protein